MIRSTNKKGKKGCGTDLIGKALEDGGKKSVHVGRELLLEGRWEVDEQPEETFSHPRLGIIRAADDLGQQLLELGHS